tara:strand:- start:942 stop:1205 length:264 start_codon:yes stop_codon:yes gene_type:complete
MRMTERSALSIKYLFIIIFLLIVTGGLSYLLLVDYYENHNINKDQFLCTKIEQIGKNVDDVACVQYTAQKYYPETMQLNSKLMKKRK